MLSVRDPAKDELSQILDDGGLCGLLFLHRGPCGTMVQNYGYYTLVNGVKWLYIQVTYQGVKYTGFSCLPGFPW